MSDIPSWFPTDDLNSATPPDGFPEGMSPASVNNAARAVMGAVRRFWSHNNVTLTTTNTGNAYVLTYDVGPTAYANGEIYAFVASATNTGAATLNINALGALPIVGVDGAALSAGDIVASQVTTVWFQSSSNKFVVYGTGIVLGGDATGSGDKTLNLALVPTGVTAGTYAGLTVDTKGRITLAVPLVLADITGGLGFTPVNKAGDTMVALTVSGNETVAGNLTVGGTLNIAGTTTATAINAGAISAASLAASGAASAGGALTALSLFGTSFVQSASHAYVGLNLAQTTYTTGNLFVAGTLNWNMAGTSNVVGTNGNGTRTVSTAAPSGGANGDIWYQTN